MNKFIFTVILLILLNSAAPAQTIRVHPTGVNVNSQNPTVVFLTFGQIPAGYVPAESLWCGALVPATPPALGQQCRPDTIYGSLPARYNQSQTSGSGGLTDIMAIPPSVARRAYQAAQTSGSAGFFYVRRFVSTAGQPDQFVVVTCRMSGGGARVPFALTNVEIKTPSKEPILFVKAGEKFPEIYADIWYNGTGRLKGRWEIVQPGEEPPAERDLLTESTLPIEQRGTQKRYRQIARFNYFLPPARRFKLPLEQIDKVPTLAAGQYILLLRIEATDDKESDSNLAAVGAGAGVVHSGAVSAFPLPTLKFFVIGNDERTDWQADARVTRPAAAGINQPVKTFLPVVFSWKPFPTAALHRLEIFDENEKMVLSALLLSPISSYRAPSWFLAQYDTKNLTWRVVALDEKGAVIRETRKQFF